MNYTFYEALERIPLGIAVTIEFAGPLAVAVATSRRRLDLVWAALAAVGIVLLADPFGADALDPVGLAFVLAAAAFWAAYILIAQRAGAALPGRRPAWRWRWPSPRSCRSCPGLADAGADLPAAGGPGDRRRRRLLELA